MDPHAEAEAWFARLHADDVTPADRLAFERWCARDPDHPRSYREVERLWHRSGALHRSPEIAALTAQALRDVSPARARRRWRLPLAAAATVLVAVAIGLLQPWQWVWGERMTTATGEQRRITLSDGSTVLLDAQSRLRLQYSDTERRLVLDRGQAQFKVRKDASRPFVVAAGDGQVTALGTEFQVRVDGTAVTVTLLEGKVAVDMPTEVAAAPRQDTLIPGEQIRFNARQQVFAKQPADLEVAQSWPRGDLVFKNWRLDALVAEMNRYSDTKLHIRDPAIADVLVSGRFHAGDHQSLILALEADWPIRVQVLEGKNEIALLQRP